MGMSHKDRLIKFLVQELGSKEAVKRFSSELKELNICDLSDTRTQEYVMTQEGAVYLFTLVSHFNFGLLNKLVEIQHNIKGNK
jgi:hypothetical protein